MKTRIDDDSFDCVLQQILGGIHCQHQISKAYRASLPPIATKN